MPLSGLVARVGASRPRPGVECRVRERHPTELPASCQPVAGRQHNDPTWPGVIRDISGGGLGLVLQRRYERGTSLAVELPATPDRPGDTFFVRVAHVTRQPDGRWLLGCSFVGDLGEDEIQRLLRLAEPPPLPATVVPGVTFRGVTAHGKVLVLSVKRLAPKTAWPPPKGATISLRVGGKAGTRTTLRLMIDSCRELDGRWVVDGRFVETPDLAALRASGPERAQR
ncbi:MAG: PilZ domain-containing protein [Gemmataceae bacterium]|nr:PilZ domain-containing protein [Gemmataceae bacterium]